MHSGSTWRLGHRPALDGLRGVAVLLVVIGHTFPGEILGAGTVGVTVFFVLSGFLITSLLLEERTSRGRTNFAAFYLRRARRLLPALVALLVAVVLLTAVGLMDTPVADWFGAVGYVENWRMAAGVTLGGGIGHTWSLAIEEQFYLVWPALLAVAAMLVPRAPRWVGLAATFGLIAASVAAIFTRLDVQDVRTWVAIYYSSDTRAVALVAGCAVAIYLTGRRPLLVPRAVGGGVLAAGVVLLLAVSRESGVERIVAAPLAASMVAAAMILVIASGHSSWLSAGWLRLVGRRSYALYLWQPIAYEVVAPHGGVLWTVLALTASWVLALASWRWVERPFMARKTRDRLEVPAGERRDDCGSVGARQGGVEQDELGPFAVPADVRTT